MKVRRLTLLIALLMLAAFCLAPSASADPPKTEFTLRWGYFLDYQVCGDVLAVTGNAAHVGCEYYKVPLYDAGTGDYYGTLEFRLEHTNMSVYVPEWGWWRNLNLQGWFRIQPAGVDGYWEGNLASVNRGVNEAAWYEPISKSEGIGYGAVAGQVLKTTHYYEPCLDGTSPFGGIWPMNSVQIIETGRQ